MHINVRTVANGLIEVSIEPDQPLEHLREALDAMENITNYHIIYTGKPLLDNSANLGEIGIGEGETVYMIIPGPIRAG